MHLLWGIYARDNRGEALEVGDKLLIYIQHAEGDLSPMGDSCAFSSVMPKVFAAPIPPVGLQWEMHNSELL